MNHKTSFLRTTTLVTALLTAGSISLRADNNSDLESLREQLRQLDQKIRILERKQENKDEDAAAKAKTQPVVNASASGFGLSSPDKAYDLKFKLLAQVDGRLFIGDEANGNSGFLLRRIRPSLQGTVASLYDFSIVPEFGGGNATTSSASLVDAWVAARLNPYAVVKLGKFASPVGLEPGSNRHFIESPFVNTLLPNRDIGAEIGGSVLKNHVSYELGVFNGTRNNTTSFATDGDDGKTLAGRVNYQPLKDDKGNASSPILGLGFSAGREEGSPQTIVTNGQQSLLSFGSLTADGGHFRVAPSLSWYEGSFSGVAEYAWEQQDYRRSTTVLFEGVNTAWRVTAGYVLTGEESTSKGVTPATNFNWQNGTWGAFELVARASGLDLDNDLFVTTKGGLSRTSNASGATAYGIGLNWYLNRILRAQLNFEHTEFKDGGAGVLKHDENALFSRLQVSF